MVCGLLTISVMDASKSHSRSKINASDSWSGGYFRHHCSNLFSKTIRSFVGIHKSVKFAVKLQIVSLAKFDVLQSQKTAIDCNTELMSALSNDCINFDEAVLFLGKQQDERALNASSSDIYNIRQELSLDSSKLCRTELDFICSFFNNTVRRIAFLTHWQSFPDSRISYSDILKMFCRNLSRAFNHSQKHLTSHCFCQSEDDKLDANLGKYCNSMCFATADQAVSISTEPEDTFSSRFSQGSSERNTDRLMQREASKFSAAGVACSECTKTKSLATDSFCSNSACRCYHLAAVGKSGITNSSYLYNNLSGCHPSPISVSDTSGQFTNCPCSMQSAATCDMKANRCKQKHRQFQRCIGLHSPTFCRKQTHQRLNSRAKRQHKSNPPVEVVGSHLSYVSSDSDVECLMGADTCISQTKKEDLDVKHKRNDIPNDVNCAERPKAYLEVKNYGAIDDYEEENEDFVYDACSSVVDDRETGDNITDEESTDEEETDEDVSSNDEPNCTTIWDEEITREETFEEINEEGKTELNDRDTAAGVKSVCKSSFFVSPSEMDSSDFSSDSDCKDDDFEVDGWDSIEKESAGSLFSGICESFSFNGLYFPGSCSSVEAKLSLEELKKSDRTRLLSVNGSSSASTLDCSLVDNGCDDIVFCDDQQSHCCSNEDEEELPLTNLSHLQGVTAKWNDFYSTSREVEKQRQNKKQVRFVRDASLVTTYAERMSEAEDYAAARKGPWEEYARDRDRFNRRIRDTAEQISWVLSASHRTEVYRNSFSANSGSYNNADNN